MNGERGWRLSGQAWLALFSLGIALWLTITNFGLIVEIGAVLFGAYLLNLALRPIVDHLETKRIPRAISASLIYALLVGFTVLMVLLLVPVVRAEIASIRANGPAISAQINAQLARTPLETWIPSLNTTLQTLSNRLDTVVMDAASTVINIFSLLLNVLVLLILGYFLVVERMDNFGWLKSWVDPHWHPHLATMEEEIVTRLSRWVWAQAGIALYFAITSTIGLLVLGIPYALTIGVVGGILEVVPYLGGIIAATLAAISALTVNVWAAVGVIVLYIILAAIESHIVAPLLYGRAIGLRSAGVLIALLIGAKAAGVIGVFFAVPLAVIITTIVHTIHTVKASNLQQNDIRNAPPSGPINHESQP